MEGRTEVADERDIEEGDVEGAVEGIAQEEETNLHRRRYVRPIRGKGAANARNTSSTYGPWAVVRQTAASWEKRRTFCRC